jgi:hypothetical protein
LSFGISPFLVALAYHKPIKNKTMRNYFSILMLFSILSFTLSCSQNKKPEKLKGIVDDVIQIDPEKLSGSEPISQLAKVADEKADKTISLNKTNMAQSLDEARNYNKVLIIVGTHTLLKIKNFDDCKKSTAWGACMPKGVGLTQKGGDFEKETDYINNLIGLPDGQNRKMFLFK